ncbi:hypothetical protein ACL02S_16380 [Nocardia sp. 004]|uniref:hypothetical protein n=1 Tax=Nocardia sp. 004 TaxID=3385978 RepID=UPI0039A0C2E7
MKTVTTTATTTTDPTELILTGLGHVLIAAVTGVAVVVKWAVLFPMVSVPAAATVAAWLWAGWPAGLLLAVASGAALIGWRVLGPHSFRRWLTHRARTRAQAWWWYRRRWARLSIACRLGIRTEEVTHHPRLLSVTIGESVDRLRVRMLPGQSPDTYTGAAIALAHAFGVSECRAGVVAPSTIELAFRRRDALAEPTPLPTATVEWLWDEKEAA